MDLALTKDDQGEREGRRERESEEARFFRIKIDWNMIRKSGARARAVFCDSPGDGWMGPPSASHPPLPHRPNERAGLRAKDDLNAFEVDLSKQRERRVGKIFPETLRSITKLG